MGYPPISFVRGGYVSDMNRLGFKEGGEVTKEEPSEILAKNSDDSPPVYNMFGEPRNPMPSFDRTFKGMGANIVDDLDVLGMKYLNLRADINEPWNKFIRGSTGTEDKKYDSLYSTEKDKEDRYKKISKLEKDIQERTPENLTLIQQGLRSALQSAPRTGLGMLVSIVNPPLGLAIMGGAEAVDSYGDARAKGKEIGMSLVYGTTQGSIEAWTERLGLGPLLKSFKKKGLGTDFIKYFGREIQGEQLATLGQSLVSWGAGLDEALGNPELSVVDKLLLQGERQIVTLIATLATTGSTAGGKVIVDEVREGSQTDESRLTASLFNPNNNVEAPTQNYLEVANANFSAAALANKVWAVPDSTTDKVIGYEAKDSNIVYMTPGEFLTLAKVHPNDVSLADDSLKYQADLIKKNQQFNALPVLTFSVDGDVAKITGHDGRHRAQALQNSGTELIPVVMLSKDKGTPTTLINEDGHTTYSFPQEQIYNRQLEKTKVDTKEDIKTNNEIIDELSDYFGASKIEMGQLKNTKKVLSERHKIFPILQRHTYTVTDETQGIYNRIVKRLETGATDSRYYPENTYALTTTKATQERLAKADKKRIDAYKTIGGSNIRLDKISPLVLPLLDNFLARQLSVAREFNIPPLRRVARKSTMESLLKSGMSASMGYGTLELNITNLNKILAYKETNLLPDRYSKLYESLNTTLNSKGSWATLKELKKTFPDAAENQDITWWEDKGVLTLEDIYKLDKLNITFKYARYKDDVLDITEELDNLHFKSSLESFNAGTKDVVTSEAQTALDIFAIQERLKYATEQMLSAKLVWNTNFPVSLKIIANDAEDSVDGFYQGDLSYNVSDYYALPATQVTNTFNHEAGHHINQLIGMNNRRGRSIFIKTFEYIDNHGGVQSYFDTTKDLKHISTYSKTDLKEWFAESYSYYQTAKGLSTFHTPLGKPKDVLDPLFFELLTQAAKYGKKYKDKQRDGIIFTDKEMIALDNEYSVEIRILFTNRFKGE